MFGVGEDERHDGHSGAADALAERIPKPVVAVRTLLSLVAIALTGLTCQVLNSARGEYRSGAGTSVDRRVAA
jgi:hypothetical protein